MLEMMARKPCRIIHYARTMAELHAEMHNITLWVDIPNQHQQLIDKIKNAPALLYDLQLGNLAVLNGVSGGDSICHGDFHPGNINVTEKKHMILNWVTASLGNPLADLAQTMIILQGLVESDQIQNPWHKIAIRMVYTVYLRHYFFIRPEGEEEYSRWLPVVAAARLSENITEVEGWLIIQAAKGQ